MFNVLKPTMIDTLVTVPRSKSHSLRSRQVIHNRRKICATEAENLADWLAELQQFFFFFLPLSNHIGTVSSGSVRILFTPHHQLDFHSPSGLSRAPDKPGVMRLERRSRKCSAFANLHHGDVLYDACGPPRRRVTLAERAARDRRRME